MGGWNIGWGGFGPKSWNKKVKRTLFGDDEKEEQRSKLTPEQQEIHDQWINSIKGPGAGGAFGTTADYYRDLMSDDSQTMNRLSAPEMRRFNEETIPGLSEQFAGMGAGGLSSSGFRNAAVNAGTDLSERLGSIRANLRAQGAAGLSNLSMGVLNPIVENTYTPPTGGFADYAAPVLGAAATAFGGPALGSATSALTQGASNIFSTKGKTSPYGGPMSKTPGVNTYNSSPYGRGQVQSPYMTTMQGMR